MAPKRRTAGPLACLIAALLMVISAASAAAEDAAEFYAAHKLTIGVPTAPAGSTTSR